MTERRWRCGPIMEADNAHHDKLHALLAQRIKERHELESHRRQVIEAYAASILKLGELNRRAEAAEKKLASLEEKP